MPAPPLGSMPATLSALGGDERFEVLTVGGRGAGPHRESVAAGPPGTAMLPATARRADRLAAPGQLAQRPCP